MAARLNKSGTDVCAILVTFHPHPGLVQKVIAALIGQVGDIVVVDNTTKAQNEVVKSLSGVNKIIFGENKGVGVAHNAGIEWARRKGFGYVLLMDQDSVPDGDMVSNLIEAMQALTALNAKPVAAVGPNCYSMGYHAVEPFVVRKRYGLKRVRCQNGAASFPVEYLISSGSLISIDVIDRVGGMNEALFVDYTDIEWGLRAQAKGYHCHAVCRATLRHQLGEVIESKIGPVSRNIVKHQPERCYYQFRNAFWLFKQPYVPLSWMIYLSFRQLLVRFLMQALLIPPRKRNLIMMLSGLYHGACGVRGPYPGNSPT